MLEYFTPSTLREMYQDVYEARMDMILDNDSLITLTPNYINLQSFEIEIEQQYKNLTGNDIRLEIEGE